MAGSLEAKIDQLAQLGEVRLFRMADGCWSAALEYPAPQGITAQVRSDFKHATHEEAIDCVFSRIADLKNQLRIGDR